MFGFQVRLQDSVFPLQADTRAQFFMAGPTTKSYL